MDKTVAALVKELAKLSTEVASDKDLANVASVSAGAHNLVTAETSGTAETHLQQVRTAAAAAAETDAANSSAVVALGPWACYVQQA
jgi:hypothetical protein